MRYSCAELARFQLLGYPKSRQGWDKLVKERNWEFVELHGKGRGGFRREYLPSEEVLNLIKKVKNSDIAPPVSSEKTGMEMLATNPNVTSGRDKLHDLQLVSYGNTLRYSCAQLAKFQLVGHPKSRQGWDKLVKEKKWEFVELHGKGRGGFRREYLPSEEVLYMIKMGKNNNLVPPVSNEKIRIETLAIKPKDTSGFEELLDQQDEWAEISIRLERIIRNNQVLANADNRTLKRLSLMALRCIYMFCEGNIEAAKLWLDNALSTNSLVKLVYEGFCNGKNIDPACNYYINPPMW
ncbi:hypothetical protein [Gallionella capsiferriformans]|uniref:HTH Mu-type domain-containing protein n=1 Tax=Gallionella capsiferriformans (strain ES-2) TaxID=395494 RepID=D9SDF2_GALCS|nr:hypothetical protein [Gallionella capsiferriformans]ADL56750.1 hypothetical protein Galf_2755 [Gallionella capsiferriformans ES-2]